MLKTHFTYLQRALKLAIGSQDSEHISETLNKRQAARVPVYRLISDIVSDARFYSVIDSPNFWRLYAADEIRKFIDAISADLWGDEEALTLDKEDFLNRWFASHLMAMPEEEKAAKTRLAVQSLKDAGLLDKRYIDGLGGEDGDDFSFGVNDLTNGDEDDEYREKNLPDEIAKMSDDVNKRGTARCTFDEVCRSYLEHIDPTLLKLAKMIGRSSGESSSQSRFGHGRKSDIAGITVSDDLNSLLPSELAMLATEETHDIFLYNYTRKRLQTFSSASRIQQKGVDTKGAIVMCIDTSGSMWGAPSRMAKTLAMAIAVIAQKDQRPVFVVNYSYKVSFFVLTNLKRQFERFLSFLSMSYNGGNDESLLFDFLLAQLPQSKRYGRLIKDFDGADLLMISDFIWRPLCDEVEESINKATTQGLRLFTLEIGGKRFEEVRWEDMPKNGEWFLQKSTHHFVFVNRGSGSNDTISFEQALIQIK